MATPKHKCKWPKGSFELVTEPGVCCISVPFIWELPAVKRRLQQGSMFIEEYRVGGPAVEIMPEYLQGLGDHIHIGGELPGILQWINPQATRSSLGCDNKCPWCAIGRGMIEPGGFRELDDWPDQPLYIDNNILACSRKHFDKTIDRLKRHPWSDFNQGIDARLLTKYHAERFTELKAPTIRLAWDRMGTEKAFLRAHAILRAAGIPASRVHVYVLIGYKDAPADALYRLQAIRGLGSMTCPMRYRPLECLEMDYVDTSTEWTDSMLKKFMQYFWCARLSAIPFDVFERKWKKHDADQQHL